MDKEKFYLIPLHWLPGVITWKEIPKSKILPSEYITGIIGYGDFKFPIGFFSGVKMTSENINSKTIADKKYRQSEKGRACTERYNHSEKRQLCEERFLEKIFNTPKLRQSRMDRVKNWRENNQSTHQKLRKEVLLYLGNKCLRCGIEDFRVLQIDHINGNGYQERMQLGRRASVKYYRHIIEVNGEGYQLLCANCNWIKRYEQREQN